MLTMSFVGNMKTLISYELHCSSKRCNIRHAFYCNPSDVDGRINKLKDKYGDGFKLVLRQTREVG